MLMTSKRNEGQSAPKRLLHELRSYQEEPNPALVLLRPARDDDLFVWDAVLRGVPETAYEGVCRYLARPSLAMPLPKPGMDHS